MGEPTTENKTAIAVNSGIKTAGDTIIAVAEQMIIAAVPALGYPIISQIWKAVFDWVAGYFIRAAEQGATFTVIDLQIAAERKKFSEALSNIMAIQKTGNQDEIKKAIQAYADAHSALVHFDGSAPIK